MQKLIGARRPAAVAAICAVRVSALITPLPIGVGIDTLACVGFGIETLAYDGSGMIPMPGVGIYTLAS